MADKAKFFNSFYLKEKHGLPHSIYYKVVSHPASYEFMKIYNKLYDIMGILEINIYNNIDDE